MSQQQMNFDEISRSEPVSYSTGYEEFSHPNDRSHVSFGQKLSGQEASKAPTPGQRLALAIISLLLWIMVLLIMLISVAFAPPGNPTSRIVYPLLILGLLIFSALVFVINILFNRKH